MSVPLRTVVPLLAALLALSSAGPAASASDRALPAPGIDVRVVRAGDVVEVRWSLPPEGVEELELMLSVDGGRRFALHASPELEGRECRWRWTVPALATSEARLRLRMRLDGREVEGPVGAGFAIEAPASHGRERVGFHEAGWWSWIETAPPIPHAWDDGAPRLGRHAESAAMDAPTRTGAIERPWRREMAGLPPDVHDGPREAATVALRPPRVTPRN